MKKALSGSNLKELKNIGNVIEHHLNRIGIFTKAELIQLGAVEVFKQMKSLSAGKVVKIRYLLSLEGAILNLYWKDVPEKLKYHLKKQVGLAV